MDGGTADLLPNAQPTSVDTISMLIGDGAPERLCRALTRQDTGKALPKRLAAAATAPLASFQFKNAAPIAKTLVTYKTNTATTIPKIRTDAMRRAIVLLEVASGMCSRPKTW